MKINSCPMTFKSNYKFVSNNDTSDIELRFIKMSNEQLHYDKIWNDNKTLIEQGIYGDCYIWANDRYDKKIEAILLRNGIDFKKTSKEELRTKEHILSRIVQTERDKAKDCHLLSIDTKKFDELFKKTGYYIGKFGEKGIEDRYNDFIDYLESGKPIYASTVTVYEENNEPKVVFTDGRHRYSVYRDLGFESIPLSMNTSSKLVAEKYGLIKK